MAMMSMLGLSRYTYQLWCEQMTIGLLGICDGHVDSRYSPFPPISISCERSAYVYSSSSMA